MNNDTGGNIPAPSPEPFDVDAWEPPPPEVIDVDTYIPPREHHLVNI